MSTPFDLNLITLATTNGGEVEQLAAALESEGDADRSDLWTEQFAASGKTGKG